MNPARLTPDILVLKLRIEIVSCQRKSEDSDSNLVVIEVHHELYWALSLDIQKEYDKPLGFGENSQP